MGKCKGIAEVIIGNQRHGLTGIVPLQFDRRLPARAVFLTVLARNAGEGEIASAAKRPERTHRKAVGR